MTKEQEEAIEIIDKMIKSYIEADECGLSNNDFKHEIRAMKTVLNMLQEQQEANKKKDKIIDLMTEIFYKKFKAELLLEYGFESEEQLKQYFERKVRDVKN